jgi:hypothetical protein
VDQHQRHECPVNSVPTPVKTSPYREKEAPDFPREATVKESRQGSRIFSEPASLAAYRGQPALNFSKLTRAQFRPSVYPSNGAYFNAKTYSPLNGGTENRSGSSSKRVKNSIADSGILFDHGIRETYGKHRIVWANTLPSLGGSPECLAITCHSLPSQEALLPVA